MATVTKKTVAPFYAVGAVWLAWSVFFPLYRVSDYLLCAGLSLAAELDRAGGRQTGGAQGGK